MSDATRAPLLSLRDVRVAFDSQSGTREVLHCLLEGLRWLWGAEAVRVAGRSGIS